MNALKWHLWIWRHHLSWLIVHVQRCKFLITQNHRSVVMFPFVMLNGLFFVPIHLALAYSVQRKNN